MPLYDDHDHARTVAKDLVHTAIESGSIQFLGVVNSSEAENNAKADAAYLHTLISELATKLTQ